MTFLPSRRLRVIALLAVAYCVVTMGAGVAFVELSLRLPRRLITPAQVSLAHARAQELGAELREVSIRSKDGLRLDAWLVRPKEHNGSVVVLFHGVTDNRLGMGGFAELFVRHGYSVLMPDARTHGQSEGTLATYGVAEADDVRRWVDWLYAHERPHCVFGLGESMGAAIVLQSLAQEQRFCAVIAESAFSDLREAVFDRIGGFLKTGPGFVRVALRPTVEAGFVYSKWRYDLDFAASSPRQAVAASRVPVLLIHGERDDVIHVRNSRSIQSARPEVEFWPVPGAHHTGAWSTQPQAFEQRVLAWFQSHAR